MIQEFSINMLPRTEEADARYTNPDNDPRGPWASGPCHAKTPSEKDIYEITTPSGRKLYPPEGTSWRFSKEKFPELVSENRIWFGKNGNNVPRIKRFLSEVSEGMVSPTILLREIVGDNQEANTELSNIIGKGSFSNPKPVRLIKRILQLATDKNSLVLDSFAGSGTTGHTVLSLNKEDGGKRQFILVEMDEKICQEVTAQRLQKIIQGYSVAKSNNDNNKKRVEGLGGGFRFCKLGDPLFDEFGDIKKDVSFTDLAHHIFFSETGLPLPKNVKKDFPLIGVHKDTAYYLLFNGILGDKRVNGGNILTSKILEKLPKHSGPKVIFGEGTRISVARLRKGNIMFKQVPYEIKVN